MQAFAFGLLAASMAACTTGPQPELPVTWKTDVAPLMASQCTRCHTGPNAPGNYRTTDYHQALGDGSDTVANIIAGDASCLLLTTLEGDHGSYLGEGDQRSQRLATLRSWVVDQRLAYFVSAGHLGGIQNPADPEFHGKLVADEGWSMTRCQGCHGDDFQGGVVETTCNSCHADTPNACNTCHGAGAPDDPAPVVYPNHQPGAHAAHLSFPSGRFNTPLDCSDCHLKPETLDTAGHVDNADGQAEITFGPRAKSGGLEPSYDPSTGTCSGTYCHAGQSGGKHSNPSWTETKVFEQCDECHGAPPSTMANGDPHPQSSGCDTCHPQTVAPDGSILDPAVHLDGQVEIRAGIDQCDGCHSAPQAPVPFKNARGETDTTLLTVGDHAGHAGPGPFHAENAGTTGYGCDACHLVPATLGDPAHIDGGDAELTFGTVATSHGSTPSFDRTTGTCSEVWCHGAKLADSGSGGVSPVWNDPSARVVCGSCHGLPPTQILSEGGIYPHPQTTSCEGVACHGRVIDANFQWVDVSLHIDGIVEIGP